MAIRTLIVEDSQISQYLIRKFAEDNGAEVVGITSKGDEAEEIYKNKRPDLVFMDLVLEDTEGLNVIKKIKEIDESANIVVCSSLGDEKSIAKAQENGIFSYLIKPITSNQIKQTMSNVAKLLKSKSEGNGPRTLVVDDSEFMRKLIKKHLTEFGCQIVAEAGNGNEAIEMFEKHKPTLVLMDIVMPELDGIAAMKGITQRDQNANIVVVTSLGDVYTVKEAFQAGAKDYLVKPFTKIDLKHILENQELL